MLQHRLRKAEEAVQERIPATQIQAPITYEALKAEAEGRESVGMPFTSGKTFIDRDDPFLKELQEGFQKEYSYDWLYEKAKTHRWVNNEWVKKL